MSRLVVLIAGIVIFLSLPEANYIGTIQTPRATATNVTSPIATPKLVHNVVYLPLIVR